MKDIIDELQIIADDFYQNKIKTGTEKMPGVVRKLGEIISCLAEDQQQELQIILRNAMEAMETKRYIMLADILVFDLKSVLEDTQTVGDKR